jgi:hypothetical protein
MWPTSLALAWLCATISLALGSLSFEAKESQMLVILRIVGGCTETVDGTLTLRYMHVCASVELDTTAPT